MAEKVKRYYKLVRDKIPEIIEDSGKVCTTEVLSNEQYITKLSEKLAEEVDEYLASGLVEELADISEVIRAILEYKNVSIDEFERVRLQKLEARGGFTHRLLLKEVIEE